MEPVQLVLPAFATLALGAALLMPLRDDRRGRRATIDVDAERLEPAFLAGLPARRAETGAPLERVTAAVAAFKNFFTRPETLENTSAPAPPAEAPEVAPSPPEVAPPPPEVTPPPTLETAGHVAQIHSAGAAGGTRPVPLTRRPLRPAPGAIAWPRFLNAAHEIEPAERIALLRELCERPEQLDPGLLPQAYREETDEGRPLVLRALARARHPQAEEILCGALRAGNDEERAAAVDGLTALGARERLPAAFGDRIDAIAAKAALAYFGIRPRAEYRAVLERNVAVPKCDAILALLAGILP